MVVHLPEMNGASASILLQGREWHGVGSSRSEVSPFGVS